MHRTSTARFRAPLFERISLVIAAALALTIGRALAAQEPAPAGTISGRVTERATQQPVAQATVHVEHLSIDVRTDADGHFVVRGVPAGTQALRVTRIGFAPVLHTDVVVSPSRPTEVDVALDRLGTQLAGVSVQASAFAKEPAVPTTTYNLNYDEIRRSPGALGDVDRLVQSLPGVVNPNDQRNDVIARGGSPIENLTLVDNIEVPNLNHFSAQNTGGGPISMLNTEFVRDATFYAGGFSSQYGNRLSSVLDIHLRDGDHDRVRSSAEVSFAGAGARVEGPLGHNGSFLGSVRQSYLDMLAGPFGLPAVPHYTNWQAKLTQSAGSRDELSFVTIGGLDHISEDADPSDRTDPTFRSVQTGGWRTINGINWQRRFGSGYGVLTASDAYSTFDSDIHDLRLANASVFHNRSGEGESTIKYNLTLALGQLGELQASASLKHFRNDMNIDQPFGMQSAYSTDPTRLDTMSVQRRFGADIDGGSMQLTRSLGGLADLTLGGRVDYFSFARATRVSPRAALAVHLTPRLDLSASAGRYHEQVPLVYAAAFPENHDLAPIRADHFVAGLAYEATASTRLSAEVYRKNYADYPVSVEHPTLSLANIGDVYGVDGLLFPLTGQGRGRAQGVELFAQQKFTGSTYGQISYSHSSVEHTALDGVWRRGAFDTPDVVTAIVGWKPNPRWELSSRFSYASGRPTTPILDSIAVAQNRLVYDLGRVNADRAPGYERLDLRVDRRFAVRRSWVTMFLEVQNATDHDNVFHYEWNSGTHALKAVPQVGFLPVLGLNVEF